jgi:peptide/nickel transport system substrate-binding protein
MKKLFALLVAAVMVFALFAACAEKTDDPGTDPTDNPTNNPSNNDPNNDPNEPGDPWEPSGTLTVAYAAEMNGNFINGFGNNAYDLSIKTLLHGFCATYDVTPAGEFILNPTVVKSVDIDADAAGNKTYTFTLHEDLKWSNGTAITAKDYVAGILYGASPAWRDAGATTSTGYGLVGYRAYNHGTCVSDDNPDGCDLDHATEYFEGVRLLGDYVFSLTIDAGELPYFYEVTYVGYGPMYMETYMPGVNVVSDENGSKLDGDISAHCERIATDPNGERYAPSVVCGPYTFVSFDNQIATLKFNPHFKGDMNGNRPNVEFIVQMAVPEETDVDMLIAGEVDMLPNNIQGDKIERTKANEGTYTTSHLRNGYGVLHMVCDWGPTADRNVRWAIACLVDRTQLLDQVLGGYGGLVDTEVGQAQWMYQLKRADLQEQLIPIAFNIAKANEYLDASEWKFEADGTTPFDPSKADADGSYMRHNADGQMLVIEHAAASQAIGDILEIEFLKNTPLVGMKYNFSGVAFNTILDEYYEGSSWDPADRTYSTYSMGTGWTAAYDPYFYWHTDWVGTDYNPTGLSDSELDALMIAMRRVDGADKATFLNLWFDYQLRWNYLLPSVPLYSNEYFNLVANRVSGVNTTPFLDWYEIICDIKVS